MEKKEMKKRKQRDTTFNHLSNGLQHTHSHDGTPKRHDDPGHVRLPRPRGQLDVAQRRQDVGHGGGARAADQVKDGADVARQQAQHHGAEDQARGEEQVQVHVEGLAGKVVVEHDLAADKGLERQGREHVEAEAQPRDVDHGVVGGEVVEHIALRLVAEGEEPGERHDEAGHHGHARADVRDLGEAVDGGLLEGAVDEERVVVADEG